MGDLFALILLPLKVHFFSVGVGVGVGDLFALILLPLKVHFFCGRGHGRGHG